MPNIGGPELVVVLLIFVLLFGAKKLPDLGSSVGKSIKNFKKGVSDGKEAEEEAPSTTQVQPSATAPSDQA